MHLTTSCIITHQVLLNVLETSRGVLSTLARETLSAVGIEITSRQPRGILQADGELGIVQGVCLGLIRATEIYSLISFPSWQMRARIARTSPT